MNKTQQMGLIVLGIILVVVITVVSILVGQEEVKTTVVLEPEKTQEAALASSASVSVPQQPVVETPPETALSEIPDEAAQAKISGAREAVEPEYEGVVRGPLMQ